jgi:hypothetical protein
LGYTGDLMEHDFTQWPTSKLMQHMIDLDAVSIEIQKIRARVKEELDSRD